MCSNITLSKYYQVHSGKLLTKQQLRSISFIKLLRGKLHYSNTKNCYKAKIYLWNWEHEFETIGEHLNWFDLQRLNFMLDFIIMDYFSMHIISKYEKQINSLHSNPLPVLSAQLMTAPTGRAREILNFPPAEPPLPEVIIKC